MKTIRRFCYFTLALAVASGVASAETIYGAGNFTSPLVPLADLLNKPLEFKGRQVTTQGSVAQVCARAGCWVTLRENGVSVRVLMGNHAFFVPKKLKGAKVIVEGKLEEMELETESDALQPPTKTLQFVAVGLKLP